MGDKPKALRADEVDIMELFAKDISQKEISAMRGIPLTKIRAVMSKFGRRYGNDEVYINRVFWSGHGKTQHRTLTDEGRSIIEGWKHED